MYGARASTANMSVRVPQPASNSAIYMTRSQNARGPCRAHAHLFLDIFRGTLRIYLGLRHLGAGGPFYYGNNNDQRGVYPHHFQPTGGMYVEKAGPRQVTACAPAGIKQSNPDGLWKTPRSRSPCRKHAPNRVFFSFFIIPAR